MSPSSSQTLHCHWIGAAGSGRTTVIRPRQGRWAGRRRQGSAVIQETPAPPAVAARTMLLRCCARRRAGPGASSGKSKKWCRSVTNIAQDCTDRSVTDCPTPGHPAPRCCGRGRALSRSTSTPNLPSLAPLVIGHYAYRTPSSDRHEQVVSPAGANPVVPSPWRACRRVVRLLAASIEGRSGS